MWACYAMDLLIIVFVNKLIFLRFLSLMSNDNKSMDITHMNKNLWGLQYFSSVSRSTEMTKFENCWSKTNTEHWGWGSVGIFCSETEKPWRYRWEEARWLKYEDKISWWTSTSLFNPNRNIPTELAPNKPVITSPLMEQTNLSWKWPVLMRPEIEMMLWNLPEGNHSHPQSDRGSRYLVSKIMRRWIFRAFPHLWIGWANTRN